MCLLGINLHIKTFIGNKETVQWSVPKSHILRLFGWWWTLFVVVVVGYKAPVVMVECTLFGVVAPKRRLVVQLLYSISNLNFKMSSPDNNSFSFLFQYFNFCPVPKQKNIKLKQYSHYLDYLIFSLQLSELTFQMWKFLLVLLVENLEVLVQFVVRKSEPYSTNWTELVRQILVL